MRMEGFTLLLLDGEWNNLASIVVDLSESQKTLFKMSLKHLDILKAVA